MRREERIVRQIYKATRPQVWFCTKLAFTIFPKDTLKGPEWRENFDIDTVTVRDGEGLAGLPCLQVVQRKHQEEKHQEEELHGPSGD